MTDTLTRPPEVTVAPAPTGDPPRRWRLLRALQVIALITADLAMLHAAYRLAYLIRYRLVMRPGVEIPPPEAYTDTVIVMAVCLFGVLAFFRHYIPRRGLSRIDLLYSLFLGVSAAFIVGLAVLTLAFRELGLPRVVLAGWWVSSILLIWLARVILDTGLRLGRAHGVDTANVLIVGAGESGEIIREKIRHAPELGYRIVGFVDDVHLDLFENSTPILGTLSDVPRLIEQHHVSELIIAAPRLEQRDVLELVSNCARAHVNVKLFPDIVQIMSSEVTTSDLTGLPMVQVRDVALRGWNLTIKRAMDIVVSAIALVLISPFLMALAVAVKLWGGAGPVFYTQERVGLDGKPFHLIKFRSMRADAEASTGPVWATQDDRRRTVIGTFIRRWSLDELPQLVNVLVGEMSLVGPRPERPHFVEQFSREVPRYAERHNEKAGMTGWAQVNGLRGNTSITERTKYDLFYVENWSLAFDVKICLKTIGAIFRDKNAY
ncbi:MAG: undecaprenyl-phosphate glucose phosphotransferase [Chloroflexi bacterium]|nr:undecaprenyl-phosphate glucose phosphotransferase [Chloroflexota bacterium]